MRTRFALGLCLVSLVGCTTPQHMVVNPMEVVAFDLLMEQEEFHRFNQNHNADQNPSTQWQDVDGIITEIGIWVLQDTDDPRYEIMVTLIKDLKNDELQMTAKLAWANGAPVPGWGNPEIKMKIPAVAHSDVIDNLLSDTNVKNLINKADEIDWKQMEAKRAYTVKRAVYVRYIP